MEEKNLLQYVFAIKVHFDIKISPTKLPNPHKPQNYESYDLKTKQRFQQPHSGRVFPGIVSEVTQDTARYHLSGLLVVTPCLLCMHGPGKSIGVNQKVAEKHNCWIIPRCQGQPALDKPLQNQLSPIRESWYPISVQHNIDGLYKKTHLCD